MLASFALFARRELGLWLGLGDPFRLRLRSSRRLLSLQRLAAILIQAQGRDVKFDKVGVRRALRLMRRGLGVGCGWRDEVVEGFVVLFALLLLGLDAPGEIFEFVGVGGLEKHLLNHVEKFLVG